MTRFYMHRRSGAHVFVDEEGYDYRNLEHMRAEAVLAAREIMTAAIQQGQMPEFTASFEITDEAGQLLLRFQFIEALNGDSTPQYPPIG
jgi:hypothetical protein